MDISQQLAKVQIHVGQARAPLHCACSHLFFVGSGTRASMPSTISGDVPQVTWGKISQCGIQLDHGIEVCIRVGVQGLPVGHGLIPLHASGGKGGP